MTISKKNIDQFVQEQVDSGACATVEDAQRELISKLVERDIDQKVLKGRQDIQEGHARVLNDESNQQFLAELQKKLSHNFS